MSLVQLSRTHSLHLALVVVLLAGCLDNEHPADDATDVPLLSCPPPCGVAIDAGARWEPSVAVHPADPDRIVASSQDLSKVPGALLARHWPLAHVSADGGATWTTSRIPGGDQEDSSHPLYRYNAMDDSVVTYLPDGTVLWSAIAWTRAPPDGIPGRVPPSLVVLRSEDGGRSFPHVVIVDEGAGWRTDLTGTNARGADKQWATVTPEGHVLLVWSRNHHGSSACGNPDPTDGCTELMFSTSKDSGRTWSTAGVIESDGVFSGAFPVVLPDGTWIVSYRDTDAAGLRIAVSRDDGRSWTTQEIDKTTKFPAMAVAGARVFVAYPAGAGDRDDLQTVTVRWSDDAGKTWSAPLVVDTPRHAGRTTPAIAPSGDGVVVLHWFPLEEGAQLRAALVHDGTVADRLIVATMADHPRGTGDYMGLASLPDGDVYAVWNASDGTTFTVTGGRLDVASTTQ